MHWKQKMCLHSPCRTCQVSISTIQEISTIPQAPLTNNSQHSIFPDQSRFGKPYGTYQSKFKSEILLNQYQSYQSAGKYSKSPGLMLIRRGILSREKRLPFSLGLSGSHNGVGIASVSLISFQSYPPVDLFRI